MSEFCEVKLALNCYITVKKYNGQGHNTGYHHHSRYLKTVEVYADTVSDIHDFNFGHGVIVENEIQFNIEGGSYELYGVKNLMSDKVEDFCKELVESGWVEL